MVVKAAAAPHALGDEVIAPSSCGASAAQPPPDLAVVVRCAPALVKPVSVLPEEEKKITVRWQAYLLHYVTSFE